MNKKKLKKQKSWAAGVDRLGMIIDQSKIAKISRPVAILLIKDLDDQVNWQIENYCLTILHKLAELNIFPVHMGNSNSKISKQMQIANKLNAIAAIIIGSQELNKKNMVVKWLDTQTETSFSFDNFTKNLVEEFKNK